ncbi:MAG: DUF2232 domain-containing protein [Thiothrix sp.]|nr:MAG: DUF2232 domain-containing protein [Thiothrix sp.]
MKVLAQFIMQGLPQAVLATVGFAVLAMLLPPVGLVSTAVVALVALREGATQSLYVVVISSAVLAVMMLLMQQPPAWGVVAGLMQWTPLLLLGLLLRYTSSWTMTIQAALAFCLVAVVMVYVFVADVPALWQSLLDQLARPALEKAEIPAAQIDEALQYSSSIMTGVLAASLLLTLLLSLMLARAMQAAMYNPGGFAIEFRELRFGLWPAVVGALLLLVMMVSEVTLLGELITVIVVAFFMQGLAVMHGLIAQQGLKRSWLVGVYVLLALFLTPVILLLAGLGGVDAVVDFRHRLDKPA